MRKRNQNKIAQSLPFYLPIKQFSTYLFQFNCMHKKYLFLTSVENVSQFPQIQIQIKNIYPTLFLRPAQVPYSFPNNYCHCRHVRRRWASYSSQQPAFRLDSHAVVSACIKRDSGCAYYIIISKYTQRNSKSIISYKFQDALRGVFSLSASIFIEWNRQSRTYNNIRT